MPALDLHQLTAEVRKLALAAGLHVDSFAFSYHGLPVLVLPLAAACAEVEASKQDRGRGLSPCVRDILAVLREADRPLTGMAILEAFATSDPPIEWSKTSVENYLADMIADGIIENPKDARPRGYRLPGDGRP